MRFSIEELNEKYNLQLDEIVKKIKKTKAKIILLQFPDGLKPYAISIVDYLEEKTKSTFVIWMETCYGACDTPIIGKDLEKQIDLTIQFGHNEMMPEF